MVAPFSEHDFVHLLELPGSRSPETWQITCSGSKKYQPRSTQEQLRREPWSAHPVQGVIYKWKSETQNSRKHDRKGTKQIINQNQEKVGVIPIFMSSGSSNKQLSFRISTTLGSSICIKVCSLVTWACYCSGSLVSICVIWYLTLFRFLHTMHQLMKKRAFSFVS